MGGIILITAIVLFGNSSWTMQAALSVTYTLLNVAYWSATLARPDTNWDLSHVVVIEDQETYQHPKYTYALWHAIQVTRTSSWVEPSAAVPVTEWWRQWTIEAGEAVRAGDEKWDPFGELNERMRSASGHRHGKPDDSRGRAIDNATAGAAVV